MHSQSTHLHDGIPLEELFGYARFSTPRYSPCGSYLAYLAPMPDGGAPTIWLKSLTSTQADRALIPSYKRPITNLNWLPDSKHIVFIKDTDGDERGHLYICTIETGSVIDASPYPERRVLPHYYTSAKHPSDIVFFSNRRDITRYDVIRYCAATNTHTVVAENPGNVLTWHIDSNLELRAHVTFNTHNELTLYTRVTIAEPWVKQIEWLAPDTSSSHSLFFSPCGTYLYFADTTRTETNLLQRLDIATGETVDLFQDPVFDVYYSDALITDMLDRTPPFSTTLWGNDGSLAGFSYFRERLTWHFFTTNPTIFSPLLRQFLINPEFESWIENRTSQHIIIGRCSSTHPVHYWSFHRKSQTFTFLGSTRPRLESYEMAATRPFDVPTPDGLILNCYITLPLKPKDKVPLVLKIHGGPWARDTLGFSPDIQMLASRGYACLQVNYRGSTGRGKHFGFAGWKELGAKMIDDVICATQYVIEHFPIDPARIAYMGRSYGGFSALNAGLRYTHLFKAVIAQVPLTDLRLFLSDYPQHWSIFQYHFRRRTGHPELEADMLRDQSPLPKADKTILPTFISYGDQDARVQDHGMLYVNSMPTADIHEVVRFEDEGHFTLREENLLLHWSAVMRFIHKHLNKDTLTGA